VGKIKKILKKVIDKATKVCYHSIAGETRKEGSTQKTVRRIPTAFKTHIFRQKKLHPSFAPCCRPRCNLSEAANPIDISAKLC
jgi:hypothetical protein